MDWLRVMAYIAKRLPIERVLFPAPDGAKALREFAASAGDAQTAKEALFEQKMTNSTPGEIIRTPQVKKEGGLTTEETVRYQRREIGKELLLLEKHLQQGCKIDNKPCDCCGGKHLVTLEGLAQETLGMAADSTLSVLIQWVREIEPKTTEAASASGEYDKEYPRLAIKAREFRKSIMGTESTSALLAKEVKDAEDEVSTISHSHEQET